MDNSPPVRRRGAAVFLRPDAVDAYCRLHADPWPEVVVANRDAGLANYSIYLLRPKNLLFSYQEYRGDDQARDKARLAANPGVQQWWRICRPMQTPIIATNETRRWSDLELVFFQP